MDEKPLVSVIIPTRDSEATLQRCLESIRKQSYPNIEIIAVDNYSADHTRAIARGYGARVYLMGPERTSQVNLGIREAKGRYVYRVDSDFVLEPGVVGEAVNICEGKGFDAVIIHNASDPSVSFWSKVREVERECYRDDELNVAARFLRKKVFEAVGPFDEALVVAEDYDLHNRLLRANVRIGRISAREVHIGEPRTLAEIARKHYYYGKTLWDFMKKNPERANRQLFPLRLSHLRHRSEFLRNPTLLLGFVVYTYVRYVAALIGLFSVNELKLIKFIEIFYIYY